MSAPSLTFTEYLERVARELTASQRYGQVLFNVLLDVRPDIAERVRGTAIDPFYDSYLVNQFLEAVQELW